MSAEVVRLAGEVAGDDLAAAIATAGDAVNQLRLQLCSLADRARAAAVFAVADGDEGRAATWRGALVDLDHAVRAMDLARGWAENAAGRLAPDRG